MNNAERSDDANYCDAVCYNVHDTLCLFLVFIPNSELGISPVAGIVNLLPIPLHLVLLTPKAFVIVSFGFEELLEVGLTVNDTLQGGIGTSAVVRDEGVRGEGVRG